MNKLFLLLILIISGCASDYRFIPMPQVENIDEVIGVIDSNLDDYGLINCGVNTYYRTGYYLVALEKHNKLDADRVQGFCDALELSKFNGGFKRYPDYDETKEDALCTRDDYKLIWLALFYGKKYHQCATDLLTYASENSKLAKDVWLGFASYYKRIFKNGNSAPLADIDTFIRAKITCSKPINETSDKLLFAPELIIARDVTPTYYSNKSDSFCHDKVDFNYALDVYYGENSPDCPYCGDFKQLLKGLL